MHNNFFLKKYNFVYLLVVLAIIFHIDKISLGIYANYYEHDTFEQIWTLQNEIAKRMARFELPGWFPDLMGGLPFNWQDINWLHIPLLLNILFQNPESIYIISISQFIIAFIGAHLFLSNFILKNNTTSLFFSLMWAGSMVNKTYWHVPDLAAIPLLLFCTISLTQKNSSKKLLYIYSGLLISSLNFYYTRGFIYIAPYYIVFCFFFDKNRRNKLLVISILVSIFITLINLPIISSLSLNMDEGSKQLVMNNQIKQLSKFSIFDILNLFNIFPIIFATGARSTAFSGFLFILFVIYYKYYDGFIKFNLYYFIIAIVLSKILSMPIISEFRWEYNLLPQIKLYKFGLPTSFCLLIIAAKNYKYFLKSYKLHSTIFNYIIVIFSITLLYWWINKSKNPANFPGDEIIGISNFCLMIFLLINFSLFSRKLSNNQLLHANIFVTIIYFVINIQLLTYASASHPPSIQNFFLSKSFDITRPENKYDYRISFINNHPIIANYNDQQAAGGILSQYLVHYAKYWQSMLKGKSKEEFTNYPYRAYLIDKDTYIEKQEPQIISDLDFNVELLALNNVKYILTRHEILNPKNYGIELIERGYSPTKPIKNNLWYYYYTRLKQSIRRQFIQKQYFIYEILDYLPRVFTVNRYYVEIEDIYQSLNKFDRYDFRNSSIYENDPFKSDIFIDINRKNEINKNIVPVKITEYSDNYIKIRVDNKINTILVLNENYSTEWSVLIDNKPREIFPAYGFLRSIMLKPSDKIVEFYYDPSYLYYSYLISMFSLILYIFIIFVHIYMNIKNLGALVDKS